MKLVTSLMSLALCCGATQALAANDFADHGFTGSGERPTFPRSAYDQQTTERFTFTAGPGNSKYVYAHNETTGARWNFQLLPGGAAKGRDEAGNDWRFDPATKTFVNLTTKASCRRTDPRHVCNASD